MGKVWANGGGDQRDEKQEWADREKVKKGKIGKKKERKKERENKTEKRRNLTLKFRDKISKRVWGMRSLNKILRIS